MSTRKKKTTKKKAPAKKKATSRKVKASSIKKGTAKGAKSAKGKVARRGAVLVTGASGFLGRHLVDQLVGEGATVRALVRSPSLHLERAGVDLQLGDVCDPAAVAEAMRGVTHVHHLAGFVSRDPKDAPEMYRVHVEGTRTVLRAAADAKVKRVVVASTSGTIAVSADADEVSDETAPYRQSTVSRWPYYLSKIYQEQSALELGRELGLEVVIVNPALLLGPGDVRASSTTDIEKVVKGWLPVIPRGGGVCFVAPRDAAAGCRLAMEKGIAGERYLLGAANMTLDAYLGRVARLARVASPRPLVAPKTMRAVTRFASALYQRFDVEPPLDIQSVEMAEHTWYVDATKAREQLTWQPRDPQITLSDTVTDVQRRLGKLPEGVEVTVGG